MKKNHLLGSRSGIIALLGSAALLALPFAAQAGPALSSLNLQPRDLPAGARLYSTQTLNYAQVVANGGGHAFRMRLRGLLRGNFEMFGNPTRNDMIAVESDLLEYENASRAHGDYGYMESQPIGALGKIIGIPAIGVDYFARTQTRKESDFAERIVDIVFRRGSYIGMVRVTGIDGRFTSAQVAVIAKTVDRRVVQSTGS